MPSKSKAAPSSCSNGWRRRFTKDSSHLRRRMMWLMPHTQQNRGLKDITTISLSNAALNPNPLRNSPIFFGSYLETSFDIIDAPPERYVSECSCYCLMCRRLANPQHLKAKSLTKADTNRAAKLRVRRMEMLALEEGLPFVEAVVRESLQDVATQHSASLSAYGSALLDRLNGYSDGPAVLALWRDFAWTPSGAPNRKFKLKAADILQAEQKLINILRERSAS